ncbi:MAG: dihydropteroate synthase [Polyangiaceae bacterium]|nr:dihydropteroate synthase [Polyangiaceae bacterium]
MGVLNVTPDSFSDGGVCEGERAACARVDELMGEGADLIDVGGESTRPGAAPVPAGEQRRRVEPAIRHARARGAVVSIDTTSRDVAAAALDLGASIVNDVSCLADVGLAALTASRGAALIVMHSRGSMEAMRGFSDVPEDAYSDVALEVALELAAARERAVRAGMPPELVLLDPGLGFHKSARHSYAVLARLPSLVGLGAQVVVGASRKSFLARDVGGSPTSRLGGSVAAALAAARAGAAVVRVHDVHATRQALAVDAALAEAR